MDLAWYDWIGSLGVVMILLAYFLLQLDRIDLQGFGYSTVNFVGSGLITLSLVYEFNFSAFVIEICWMAISVIGIARALGHRGAGPTAGAST